MKALFSDDRSLDSLYKSLLNQTTLDLRKEKWTFLNRELFDLTKIYIGNVVKLRTLNSIAAVTG